MEPHPTIHGIAVAFIVLLPQPAQRLDEVEAGELKLHVPLHLTLRAHLQCLQHLKEEGEGVGWDMLDFTFIAVGVGQHSDNTKANCKSSSRNRLVTSLSITETDLLLVFPLQKRICYYVCPLQVVCLKHICLLYTSDAADES